MLRGEYNIEYTDSTGDRVCVVGKCGGWFFPAKPGKGFSGIQMNRAKLAQMLRAGRATDTIVRMKYDQDGRPLP